MPDLRLAKRNVNTRDARNIEIFSLEKIKQHFDDSIALIMKQSEVAEKLMTDGKNEEVKDILRSQIVFLDSAFDFYVHELLKLGIINLFHGDWTPKTEKYQNLQTDMKTLELAVSDDGSDEWLKDWINSKYAGISFMSYSMFEDACKLLGLHIKEIADKAFHDINSHEPTKIQLREAIDGLFIRRNQIAHQSDKKRENAERQDITYEYVASKLKDIQKIIEAVNICVQQK